MARKIKEIEEQIKTEVAEKLNLSTSGVAEWRLWATVIASVIYAFELVMDSFKKEMVERMNKAIPGTLSWYKDLFRKWQNGCELSYDKSSVNLYYKNIDSKQQLIQALSIEEDKNVLTVKTAKMGLDNELVPLFDDEKVSLEAYISKTKFAGDRINIVSIVADKVNYEIDVYSDNHTPKEELRKLIKNALDKYRLSLEFNGKIYVSRVISALLDVESVMTAEMQKITITPAGREKKVINISTICEAGYFNFDHEHSILKIDE